MKFLFVSNIYPPHVRGGYELGCQTIARAVKMLGHEVRIATSLAPGYLAKAAGENEFPVDTIFEPIFGYESLLDAELSGQTGWALLREKAFAGWIQGNALALGRLLQAYQPDTIWIFNPLGLGPIGILEASLSFPARRVIHLMDDIDGVIESHGHTIHTTSRFSRLKRHFSAISCSLRTMAKNERLGSYRTHRVIYNGVNFEATCQTLKRLSGEDTGVPRLVYFGQIEAAKGLLQIVSGAANAFAAGRKFLIDLFGGGSASFRDELLKAIAEAGLTSVVSLKGYVSRAELLDCLPDYDAALMLLSGDEPFAYSVIEAAAARLPVIVTSDGGNAECFPERYPLLIGDRNNAAEVGQKICWICDRRVQAKSLGSDLRKQLKQYCDFSTVSLPAYLRVIRASPLLDLRYDLESSIASWSTSEQYGLATQIGI